MSKTYRIAIIGIGAIADIHAMAIGEIDNAQVIAGSCRTQEKGRRFAAEHGCKWYADYQQMLDQQSPDIITICTPSGNHLAPALAAIKRGIHVLCEKPLEITLERADQMIGAAATAGVVLGGIFHQRFNPVAAEVNKAALAGRFGRLVTANAYVPWWRKDEYYAPDRWQGTMAMDGGGALINQSIHAVDLMQWVAGSAIGGLAEDENPVEKVFGFTAQRGHEAGLIEVEDIGVASVMFKNGAIGQILASTAMYPGALQSVLISGRDGSAAWQEDQLTRFEFRDQEPGDQDIIKRLSVTNQAGGGADNPMDIHHHHHKANIADFIDAVDSDRQPLISGTEARKALAIVHGIYQSVRTGMPAEIFNASPLPTAINPMEEDR